jgi:hypothetical protein
MVNITGNAVIDIAVILFITLLWGGLFCIWMVSYVLRYRNRVMIVISRMDVTVVGDSLL